MTTQDPRTGEDTFDLIDDAVAALADRRGVWLGDDLRTIALVASLIQQAERWLPQLVHDARANDHGWTAIAQALGTNPQRLAFGSTPSLQSPTVDGLTSIDGGPDCGGAENQRSWDANGSSVDAR